MPVLRVFDKISRSMQRLGYLKRLIKRISTTSSSNLDIIGNDLVDVVLRKERVPLTDERVNYIKVRLFDRVYTSLKSQAEQWKKSGGSYIEVQMEIQDLYLADVTLPSQVGKLVKEDWRKYPAFGINLGFVREGTYSLNTRGLTLLYFVPEQEQKAFLEYLPEHNPLNVNFHQGLILLYSLIENDGEIFIPVLVSLSKLAENSFNDREVGDLLPEIYKTVSQRHRMRSLSIDVRERLDVLEKSAESISILRARAGYAGGGAREEASRPRLEPYTDIGIFEKPQKMKYEYRLSEVGRRLASEFNGNEDSNTIEEFLSRRFFHAVALAWQIQGRELTTSDEIVPLLHRAAKAISSPSGYAPIEELALMGGVWALTEDQAIMEPGTAREALIAYQKANPYKVRFTVDRSGTLAHARFMDLSPGD